MKKAKIICIMCCLLIMTSGCGRKDTDTQAYIEKQDDIMDQMMDEMDVEETGNASLDFLYGMIPHHKSAVEMSEAYLNYADDKSEFKDLANSIISTQTEEVKQMEEMIKRIKDTGHTDREKEDQYLKEYDSMMERHDDHDIKTESLDEAFAEGMSMHHQMAVDMAEAIKGYSDDDEVIQFADSIIAMQNKEIAQMQTFLEQSDSGSKQHNH